MKYDGHTEAPWGWFGNEHGYYLATPDRGRRYVMDFVRRGMYGAQPRFQLNNRMVNSASLVEFAVGDRNVRGFKEGKAAPSTYRYDIIGIDHPDARLIADAPALLAQRDLLLKALSWYEERLRALSNNQRDATYQEAVSTELLLDGGSRARAAFAACEKEPGA